MKEIKFTKSKGKKKDKMIIEIEKLGKK